MGNQEMHPKASMQGDTELPEGKDVLDILLEMDQLSYLAEGFSSEASGVRGRPYGYQLRMRLENEDFDDLLNRPDGIDLI